jgi:hypothetical protein
MFLNIQRGKIFHLSALGGPFHHEHPVRACVRLTFRLTFAAQMFKLILGGSRFMMRQMRFRFISWLTFICLAIFVFSPTAKATSVTINNFSFEADVLSLGGFTNNVLSSWTVVAGSSFLVGAYHPNTFTQPVPDGSNTAYVNQGGEFFQDVAALVANSTYNFSVFVGQRIDIGLPSYNIQLLDATNSTVLASGIPSAPAPGHFVNFGLTFDSKNFASSVGHNIRIEFSAGSVGGAQVNFDDATLAFSADSGSVPEPGSFVLTLLGIGLIAVVCLRQIRLPVKGSAD